MRILKDSIINEHRGETSLRGVLLHLANEFDLVKSKSEDGWCLHHLNGNHLDNDLQNLCLMARGRHQAYHNAIRKRGIPLSSEEAQQLLDTDYRNDVIKIGKELLKRISVDVREDEEEAQQLLANEDSFELSL